MQLRRDRREQVIVAVVADPIRTQVEEKMCTRCGREKKDPSSHMNAKRIQKHTMGSTNETIAPYRLMGRTRSGRSHCCWAR